MLPRDRVLSALSFRSPDKIPLQVHPSSGGLHEHGGKLLELMRACGHDFSDMSEMALPEPPAAEDFGADGNYHAFKTDEWGTKWEYRLFGVWGHPVEWPLSDLSRFKTWSPPPPPPAEGREFETEKAKVEIQRQKYFVLGGGGSLFEKLHSLRRFEDVLMDIALDTLEINRIADKIAAYTEARVRRSLALDVDAVAFGDDFGTQSAMLIAPDVWRRFFKPRYKALFEPITRAGKHVFFHSCGMILDILEDLREIGMTALWPQLPLFDWVELSKRCRELGIALQLHPDRGDLMQRDVPGNVRTYVHKMVETFNTARGGSWVYIEIDPGFLYENIEALFETVMELRR